jgi:hypothetical protein
VKRGLLSLRKRLVILLSCTNNTGDWQGTLSKSMVLQSFAISKINIAVVYYADQPVPPYLCDQQTVVANGINTSFAISILINFSNENIQQR